MCVVYASLKYVYSHFRVTREAAGCKVFIYLCFILFIITVLHDVINTNELSRNIARRALCDVSSNTVGGLSFIYSSRRVN